MKLIIQGTVTTTSHAHQSSPDEKGMHVKTNLGVNNGLVRGLPYITANSVRGMIRRAAAVHVLEEIAKRNGLISRNLYLSIVRGSFGRTKLEAGGASYSDAAASAKHVFAGLFGGGVYMFRSPWRITSDLFPVLECTKGILPALVYPQALIANPSEILAKTLMAPRDDFARLNEDARSVVEDVDQAYTEHMAKKQAQRLASASDATKSKDDLDNLALAECIIPGVPLYLGIQTDDITPAQAGMLLQALNTWVNRNALGGGSVRGRGSFVPQLSLWVDNKLCAGALFATSEVEYSLCRNDAIDACLSAYSQEIAGNLIESLQRAFPSEVADKPEKDASGKKKAGKAGKSAPAVGV